MASVCAGIRDPDAIVIECRIDIRHDREQAFPNGVEIVLEPFLVLFSSGCEPLEDSEVSGFRLELVDPLDEVLGAHGISQEGLGLIRACDNFFIQGAPSGRPLFEGRLDFGLDVSDLLLPVLNVFFRVFREGF